MAQYTLPPIETIPQLPAEERAEMLSHLFEPCDALNTLCIEGLGATTFATYNDLITYVRDELLRLKESPLASDVEWLLKILSAHPRLGAKKVESAHSRSEQASLGGPTEAAELERLNNAYEEKFPGEFQFTKNFSFLSSHFFVLPASKRLNSPSWFGNLREGVLCTSRGIQIYAYVPSFCNGSL
ncbi:hypothetical protein ABW19_dt0207789 [Dactylella cylindrospora]|nr:hypothetical protein ABW19_dt0207789 [Dactylella cylindrospora]